MRTEKRIASEESVAINAPTKRIMEFRDMIRECRRFFNERSDVWERSLNESRLKSGIFYVD